MTDSSLSPEIPERLFANWRARLPDFYALTRIDRPIGILLLGWSMLWGLWVGADGWPGFKLFVIFALGCVLTRSAGCCINDYADRHFDGHVARTAKRPLATGRVLPGEALWLAAGMTGLAGLLVLLTNAATIQLAVVAVALAAAYPFCKRVTHLPQLVLGAAFGMSIPMAFAATTGSVPAIGWALFAVSLVWSTAYDTQYAMTDREDDIKIGIKSTAILFGRWDVLAVAAMQAAVLAGLAAIGLSLGYGVFWWLGLLIAASLAVYQIALIRDRDPARCFTAFLNNHYLGMAVFAGLAIDRALAG
ncbi:MAG: 4-hydroxybenzoate octaprenyltransferase [Pseudomonadota bacterium]